MEEYKFPLQKLLDIRVNKEDESKRGFMEAQRQRNLAEERLNELRRNYKKYNSTNNEEDIVRRKIKDNYLRALSKNITESSQELQRKIEMVELKREELKQKQIERKTVETLKQKRFDAFKKDIEDKERRTNDEFALYSYIRNLERR